MTIKSERVKVARELYKHMQAAKVPSWATGVDLVQCLITHVDYNSVCVSMCWCVCGSVSGVLTFYLAALFVSHNQISTPFLCATFMQPYLSISPSLPSP